MKVIFVRPPFLPNIREVEFVENQGFILDIFGEKRPLQALEISNLYTNIQRNYMGTAVLAGFGQVSKSKEVTQFFYKLMEVGKKHCTSFSKKLAESNVPIPMSWASDITESTSYTFSDKLMMFYSTALIGLSIGYYGTSIAQSPRLDLAIMYNRLTLEIQKLSEVGANIMINNKWMEQPPMAPDRNGLIKHNNEK